MEQKVMIKKNTDTNLEVGVQAGYHWLMSQSSPRPPKLILLCPSLGTVKPAWEIRLLHRGANPFCSRTRSRVVRFDSRPGGPFRFRTSETIWA